MSVNKSYVRRNLLDAPSIPADIVSVRHGGLVALLVGDIHDCLSEPCEQGLVVSRDGEGR